MKDASVEYIAEEEATQRRPAELYHVWRDGGQHWRHTSGDVTVIYDGEDYIPATIERSQVSFDSKLSAVTMEIQAAYVMDEVFEFVAMNPVEILWVSVMKLHRDQVPLEVGVIFIGQIKSVSFKGAQASIECVGFEHFLKRVVPRWRYQLTCNHILFDAKCSLVKANYEVGAEVTVSASGVVISSPTFALEGDGYYIGGEMVFGAESRTIVNHSGEDVTLVYKMKDLADTDNVLVYPGCDGRLETCRDKFDNIVNSLGFLFIPTENPSMRIP